MSLISFNRNHKQKGQSVNIFLVLRLQKPYNLSSEIKNRTQIMTFGHSQMTLIALIFQKDQVNQGNQRHLRSIIELRLLTNRENKH